MKNKLLLTLAILAFLIIPAAQASSLLVETLWLEKHLNNKNVVLIDMSDNMQYQRFHIPGAIHLPYSILNQRTKKGVSLSVGSEKIIHFLGLLGIKRDSHVVIYDDTGGLNAARLLWELQSLNHKQVSILNGGLVQWILEGRKVTAKPVAPTAVKYLIDNTTTPSLLATLDTINQKNSILLDVRSRKEYLGHPRQKRSGHIPQAKWWSWDQSVDFENGFKRKKAAELIDSLKQQGITSKKQPIIVYCQSGHRAAQSYFTLKSLGFNNVQLYDASMAEYQQTPLPLNKGLNP